MLTNVKTSQPTAFFDTFVHVTRSPGDNVLGDRVTK